MPTVGWENRRLWVGIDRPGFWFKFAKEELVEIPERFRSLSKLGWLETIFLDEWTLFFVASLDGPFANRTSARTKHVLRQR